MPETPLHYLKIFLQMRLFSHTQPNASLGPLRKILVRYLIFLPFARRYEIIILAKDSKILDGKMNLYFGISNPGVDPGLVRSLGGGKG
jgi:hypothetical protein